MELWYMYLDPVRLECPEFEQVEQMVSNQSTDRDVLTTVTPGLIAMKSARLMMTSATPTRKRSSCQKKVCK